MSRRTGRAADIGRRLCVLLVLGLLWAGPRRAFPVHLCAGPGVHPVPAGGAFSSAALRRLVSALSRRSRPVAILLTYLSAVLALGGVLPAGLRRSSRQQFARLVGQPAGDRRTRCSGIVERGARVVPRKHARQTSRRRSTRPAQAAGGRVSGAVQAALRANDRRGDEHRGLRRRAGDHPRVALLRAERPVALHEVGRRR